MPYTNIRLLHDQICFPWICHLPSVKNVEGDTIEVSKDEITVGENSVERGSLCVEVIGVSILVSL